MSVATGVYYCPMIQYYPIESCAPWTNADGADLLSFNWQSGIAEFAIVGDSRTMVVSFPGCPVIVRMLDEFPMSTESDPKDWVGLIPHHFAYRVEGDPLYGAQSEAWRLVEGSPTHYRFMTGAGCLDVITCGEPHFALINN